MDMRSHEMIERRREDNGNNNGGVVISNIISTNIDDNCNGNNNNTRVSCNSQTLDHHQSKSPSSFSISAAAKPTVRYRECLKNHAASVGGSVHDGCGEFMPSGEEGTIEALRCAACDCHRNFHRKEMDGVGSSDLISHHRHHHYHHNQYGGGGGRRPYIALVRFKTLCIVATNKINFFAPEILNEKKKRLTKFSFSLSIVLLLKLFSSLPLSISEIPCSLFTNSSNLDQASLRKNP